MFLCKFISAFACCILYTSVVSSLISLTEPRDTVWTEYKGIIKELGPTEIFVYSEKSDTPISSRIFPEVGNGYIATQINNDWLYLNGLYNGEGVDSQRASIPSTVKWNVKPIIHGSLEEEEGNWTYTLNAAIGVFIQRGEYKKYDIEVITYAARMRQHLLVREVNVVFHGETTGILLKTDQGSDGYHSPDLDMITEWSCNVFEIEAQTKVPETDETGRQHVYISGDAVPSQFILTKGTPRTIFLTSIGFDKKSVCTAFKKGKDMAQMNMLLKEQVISWMYLWKQGRISVSGNTFLAQVTHTCQYYLLTSLPWPGWHYETNQPFFGLSPGGLAHGNDEDDYQGHVFWDMETWMYPPVLLFNPLLAEKMMDYRFYALHSAMKRAKQEGFEGARYPWESAYSGFETSPWSLSANNEVHVIGDISLAIQLLLWMKAPSESAWYRDKGKIMLEEIARYWCSRMIFNTTGNYYEILSVMPPDEYVHDANNSAFTNAIARRALQVPFKFAQRFGVEVQDDYKKWFNISEKILMPFDNELQIFLEHDSYQIGTTVKQADVVMLPYPIEYPMSLAIQKNNLEYYEKVTSNYGPAMTWGMFSIGWLSLGENAKAWELFKRNYDYVRLPFFIWTEVPSGEGAVNFITGMGGFLQSVVNGYGGLRIREEKLDFAPQLPPDTDEIKFVGIKFQGRDLTVTIHEEEVVVQLNSGSQLKLILLATTPQRHVFTLTEGMSPMTIPRQKFSIETLI